MLVVLMVLPFAILRDIIFGKPTDPMDDAVYDFDWEED